MKMLLSDSRTMAVSTGRAVNMERLLLHVTMYDPAS
jgi:hypothetical protein